MAHYYDLNPSSASNEREISYFIDGRTITLLTDNGVFSKSQIDEGTYALLKVLVPLRLAGSILDLGCGYGPIGLTIALTSPKVRVDLADINSRALNLCKKNAESLGLSHRITILQSDVYKNLEGKQYDSIVVNPPIRAGKIVTYAMYEGALSHLIDGGHLFIVIRKNQGGPSASRYIENLFGNITLLKRDKGYYIYVAEKMTSK